MRNDSSNPQASGRIVLAATILGSSMAFIDGTVVNVALPALQNALHASISDVQWVVESYALMLAALLLVGAPLEISWPSQGVHFWRRRVRSRLRVVWPARDIHMLIWPARFKA